MSQKPIFAIFEGGGAKGVAHVGAVAACERDFYFVGVAGASAGALVASLLAVGYTASELLNPDRPNDNILARCNKTPVDLLGQSDWRRLRALEPRVRALLDGATLWQWLRRLPRVWPAVALIREKWPAKGLMSTEPVRDFLNTVLRDKLTALRVANGVAAPLPERITFADLDYTHANGELLPLKIIATNVTTRELWIFDRQLTPTVEVAQAVAASIAIPIAFQPVEIELDGRTHRFVDGGLVSNLPIWVFANEKLAFERVNWKEPPVPIVGFTLRDKPPTPGTIHKAQRDGLLSHLYNVGQTGLSASQAVTERFVQDLTVATLPVGLSLLEFDASLAALLNAYNDGFRCADRELRHALIDRPNLVREVLERIHAEARKEVLALMPKAQRRKRWRMRTTVVERIRDAKGFRVTHGIGMDRDADDRLLLDERGRGTPAAFFQKDMRLTPWGVQWSNPDTDYMTKYERALVPSALCWIISVPIFPTPECWRMAPADRPEPCGVLSLDSTTSLESAFGDVDFMSLLTAQSTLLWTVLTQEPARG